MEDHTGSDNAHNHTRFLLHGGLQDLKPTGQNPEGVLHNPSPAADSVIVDLLVQDQSSAGEGIHHPGSDGEGVVTDDEIFHLGPIVHK